MRLFKDLCLSLVVLQFLSRPFVVGERIDISHSSGAKFLTGFVERVDPMRTILRTDTCMPVMIPNKVLRCPFVLLNGTVDS